MAILGGNILIVLISRSMVEFANRYSDEMFTVDEMEYIEAAACDFINIHNGLFTVNVSSESNEELTLTPPEVFEGKTDIVIGERPIDQHIKGFMALGADVEETEDAGGFRHG